MRSFGSQLDAKKGIGPGFNTLRIVLSLGIVVFHSFVVSLGPTSRAMTFGGPLASLFSGLLPAFFALSGFLVMGSALRSPSLGGFIGLRALRIVPALMTEITISALLLGTALTTMPLDRYFLDHRFFEYFGSLIGRIRTALPGVFETNPEPGVVNASLWTVRPELGCYVYLAILILIGKIRHPRFVVAVSAILLLLNVIVDALTGLHGAPTDVLPDRSLLLSFVAGNVAYLYRHWLPYDPLLFAGCLVVAFFSLGIDSLESVSVPVLTYCTVWTGLTPLPAIPLARHGDYSYGIYLYGYPVQQSVAYLFPELRTPLLNVVVSLPVILTLAAVSWHLIEKRALRLRRRLPTEPDVVGMGRTRWGLLLAMLFFYEAFLNVAVLNLDHETSSKVSALLLFGTGFIGGLALLWPGPVPVQSRISHVLRRTLGFHRS
jgi:peptidoglycan/LPS O-acetylase OafA/YrhL